MGKSLTNALLAFLAVLAVVLGVGLAMTSGQKDALQRDLGASQRTVSAYQSADKHRQVAKEVEQKIVVQWRTQYVKIREKASNDAQRSEQAIAQEPVWSNTVVPDAVVRSLRD